MAKSSNIRDDGQLAYSLGSDSGRGKHGGGTPPPRYVLLNSYSAFVGFMKLALPAIGIGLILLILVWPKLKEEGQQAIESLAVTEQDLTSRSMANPRYESFDSSDRPFVITAKQAAQNPKREAQVDLELPKARLQMKSGNWVEVTAPKGHYLEEREIIFLEGGVDLTEDSGIGMVTESARVNVARGLSVSDSQVAGHAPEGELTGEGFRMIDEGRVILLKGKSRVLLYDQAEKDDSASEIDPKGTVQQ